jgi:tetratricopeptide (TPR) repeat protein
MKKILFLVFLGVTLAALGWLGGQQPLNPLRAAEQAYAAGEYGLALRFYEEDLLASDDPAHAVFNRGEVLYKLGRFEGAARDLRVSLGTGSPQRTARSCYDLGNCALRQACRGKSKDAPAQLRDAIACYDACLTRSEATDEQLRDDARHNRELAKKLLEQPQQDAGHQLANQGQRPNEAVEECEH